MYNSIIAQNAKIGPLSRPRNRIRPTETAFRQGDSINECYEGLNEKHAVWRASRFTCGEGGRDAKRYNCERIVVPVSITEILLQLEHKFSNVFVEPASEA